MKKIAILYSEYKPVIDAIKYALSDCITDCLTECENISDYDLAVNLTDFKINADNVISCHYSLLPAFDCEEPVKEAILAGVKVTGITVYYTKTQKIIAQYPVFINNETHYEDLQQELTYIEQTLLPIVIKKILNNEAFNVKAIMKNGCNGKCGGCSSCNH